MCFDNGHSDEKLEAIKEFFDYFYEDARYSEWVLMEVCTHGDTSHNLLSAFRPLSKDGQAFALGKRLEDAGLRRRRDRGQRGSLYGSLG